MPQIPIIIPVIVAGIAVGSVIKSQSPRISRRKLMSASLVAGLLNAINAYAVDYLTPRQTFAGASFTVPQTSWIVFVVASFIGGFLIVLAVLGIAMIYARRGKGTEEELPELLSETEPKVTPR
jgi:formate hydrogenlyase subunit 3/multisubunit Na+/H+ antiporter MnhD subunit